MLQKPPFLAAREIKPTIEHDKQYNAPKWLNSLFGEELNRSVTKNDSDNIKGEPKPRHKSPIVTLWQQPEHLLSSVPDCVDEFCKGGNQLGDCIKQ